MTFGSLFSGVGGIDLGLERAGMRCAWQVEIDPQARAVLRRHWPDVALHEDVRNVGRANLAAVDLICGGFPCQDLSVAGRRAGLAGERSGLWHEFHRVLSEIRPRWVLIENVPGLLSSDGGRDLSVLLGGLADLGYWWTYRVLDSRYFGVPQRRRRVFIVGHLGAPCPPEVLLEPESLPGDSPARGEAGQGAAAGAESGAGGEGVALPLMALEGKGPNSDCDSGNVVAHTLRAEGFDASEDGTGRGTPLVAVPIQEVGKRTGKSTTDPRAGIGIGLANDPMYCLQAGAQHGVAFSINQRREGRLRDVHGSLAAEPSGTQVDRVLAFNAKQAAEDVGDTAPTLRAMPHDKSHANAGGQVAVYALGSHAGAAEADVSNRSHASGGPVGSGISEGTSYSLRADRTQGIVAAVPRRLTPVECERLQGWPDDWTRYAAEGKELADGPRYRMAGNGVTSSVAEWIGRRIIEARARLVPESDPREGE